MIHTCHRGSLRCLNADLFVAAGPVKLHFACVCACWQIFFSDDCGQRDLGREIREHTLASAHTSHQHDCLWTRSARALWEESDSMTNVWKDESRVRKEEGGQAGGTTGKALKWSHGILKQCPHIREDSVFLNVKHEWTHADHPESSKNSNSGGWLSVTTCLPAGSA